METVLITEQDFDIDVEYSALKTAGVGAVVIFAGIVRIVPIIRNCVQ